MELNLPKECGEIIGAKDPRIEGFKSDAVMSGSPDAVARPRDWQEVKEILKFCNGNALPLTVCGARTSMTGASVAENGLLMTTSHFDKLIDIGTNNGRPYAVTEPGLIASTFQREVEMSGYHYPVVPTSCDDAFVGGTVSTNATGEDFYRYGPTRSFVRELTIITLNGEEKTLSRTKSPPPSQKGRGGYFLGGEEIDRLIGSEGTLGVIKRIVFDLLERVPEIFQLVVPFTGNLEALSFIDEINRGHKLPRALEFIDSTSLEIMKTHPKCFGLSDKVKSLVLIKDEIEEEKDPESAAANWFELIEKTQASKHAVIDEILAAITKRQKEELHQLRHHIPARIGEIRQAYEKNGGGKTGGDWWVPRNRMLEALSQFYKESAPLGIDFVAYGHLGDGHPHTNFLCKNASEKKLASEMAIQQAKRAVELGGGVAAEHGIGKTKRHLLHLQHDFKVIESMRALKESFDPKWILGRGNILSP